MSRPADARKHELWQQRLLRFRRSKLSVAEFCRSEQISQASFYQWRRRLDDSRPSSHRVKDVETPKAEHFVPMHVSSSSARLQLSFPNGAEVRVDACDPRVLQDLVQVVAAANLSGSQQ